MKTISKSNFEFLFESVLKQVMKIRMNSIETAIDSFGKDVDKALKTASIFATYPAQNGLSIWGALIDQVL